MVKGINQACLVYFKYCEYSDAFKENVNGNT